MSGVLSEDAFVEVIEGGLSVDIIRNDPGLVVVAAVAVAPLGEPLEFAHYVASVVPAVATTAFPLVLEVT